MPTHVEALETRLLAKVDSAATSAATDPVAVTLTPTTAFTISTPTQLVAGPGGTYTVLGDFSGDKLPEGVTLGPGVTAIDQYGLTNEFIASYSASGTLLWAVRFGTAGGDGLFSESLDASGNVYAAGDFGGQAVIRTASGAFRFASAGPRDGLIVKISPAGKLLQTITFGGGNANVSAAGMAVSGGNVFVQGFLLGTADFNPNGTTLLAAPRQKPNSPGGTGFLASYDSRGRLRFAEAVGGPGIQSGTGSLAADGAGGAYITGSFANSVRFGGGGKSAGATLTSIGPADAYVARFNGAGVFQWAQQISGPDPVETLAIESDGHTIYVAGDFTSPLTAGGLTLPGTGGFLIGLDSAGHFTSARSIDGSDGSQVFPLDLTLDAAGNVYLAVSYSGDVTAGGQTFSSASGALIVRFAPSSSIPDIVELTSSVGATADAVAIDSAGDLAVAGAFSEDLSAAGLSLTAPTGLLDNFVLLHLPPASLFPSA